MMLVIDSAASSLVRMYGAWRLLLISVADYANL